MIWTSRCWAVTARRTALETLPDGNTHLLHASFSSCVDDNDLDEPLLGYDSDSEAHRASAGRGAGANEGGSNALVPYSINAYDWADLVKGLVAGAVTGLRGLACKRLAYIIMFDLPILLVMCVSFAVHTRRPFSRCLLPCVCRCRNLGISLPRQAAVLLLQDAAAWLEMLRNAHLWSGTIVTELPVSLPCSHHQQLRVVAAAAAAAAQRGAGGGPGAAPAAHCGALRWRQSSAPGESHLRCTRTCTIIIIYDNGQSTSQQRHMQQVASHCVLDRGT